MKSIDINIIKIMLKSAANNLMNNRKRIDDLNVLPVPDKDTGTNMSITFYNSLSMINLDELNQIGELFEKFSEAALRCAKGNSGVILSQIIRGFAKGAKGKSLEIDNSGIARCFKCAEETAYRAVMKVTDGTMLMVLKEMAEFASGNYSSYDDVREFINAILNFGRISLYETQGVRYGHPDVMDAGGAGLIEILDGALYALKNRKVIKCEICDESLDTVDDESIDNAENNNSDEEFLGNTEPMKAETSDESLDTVDDESIDNAENNNSEEESESLGNTELVKAETEIKDADNINIVNSDNVIHEGMNENNMNKKKYGIIAVAEGEGFKNILNELGADVVIDGGIISNPDTDDFLREINHIDAEITFILSNSKDALASAKRVNHFTNYDIAAIPSKNIAESIFAIKGFDAERRFDDNVESMKDMMDIVRYGYIMTANTDNVVFNVKCGDITGVLDDEIISSGTDVNQTTVVFLEKSVDKYSSGISIYYGSKVEERLAEELLKEVEEKYPNLDVKLIYGGQIEYYYGIAIEE